MRADLWPTVERRGILAAMGDPDSAATARGWWPHVRGALLLAHIVAIVLMSLPNVGKIADRARWREHRTQYEIRAAAAKARRWGLFDGSDGEFEAWLWQLAQRYVAARAIIDRPLGPYGYYCGTQQAWGMFKAPARKAESIRLEIETPSGRTLLFRNGSSHDYLSRQMSNNRFRKITGRLGRRTDLFEAMADWMAAAALRA